MLLVVLPCLLLSLPTLLQAWFTFRHLRYHSPGYLWAVFLLALVGQAMAGVAATVVSMHGYTQKGIECATGATVFFAAGVLLAAVITPGLALAAAFIRWTLQWPAEPTGSRVGL